MKKNTNAEEATKAAGLSLKAANAICVGVDAAATVISTILVVKNKPMVGGMIIGASIIDAIHRIGNISAQKETEKAFKSMIDNLDDMMNTLNNEEEEKAEA